jgi:deoxyhypusine synthase
MSLQLAHTLTIQNDIPVFCPALTDGSLGDMLYFHSYKNPGLVIDIVGDIRRLNDMSVKSKQAGMIVLGGGVCKHQIANAMLFVRSQWRWRASRAETTNRGTVQITQCTLTLDRSLMAPTLVLDLTKLSRGVKLGPAQSPSR